ncbi:hypothetical protein SAMN04488511_119108 [Pedobacter suwonensis]|uniref:Uncharacterized protein n=1 Tax=Pedobacter suwonensis TaxID=332999 RepID=A0A1I0U3G6_9SPHI|nr:hypothetical protein SAMN04488511_119108 [Pedobacter suwonensis]
MPVKKTGSNDTNIATTGHDEGIKNAANKYLKFPASAGQWAYKTALLY